MADYNINIDFSQPIYRQVDSACRVVAGLYGKVRKIFVSELMLDRLKEECNTYTSIRNNMTGKTTKVIAGYPYEKINNGEDLVIRVAHNARRPDIIGNSSGWTPKKLENYWKGIDVERYKERTLKEQLQAAIDREDYERAAELRDKIQEVGDAGN